MFTSKELSLIDKSYFKSIKIADCYIILQSKCTKHFWYILEEYYPRNRVFHLLHKHTSSMDFHMQRGRICRLQQVLEYIQSHDEFQMNGRNKLG